MPDICISGGFSDGCFYCDSQQIVPDTANKSLIPYKLITRAPKRISNVTPNFTQNQI